MLASLKSSLGSLSVSERIILALLVATFFLGLDFGFPLTVTTNDEMYFVGGVFRALAERTVLPQGLDVPYGTVNYLFSYILIGISLIVLMPWSGFNFTALEAWVFDHHYLFYLAPRLISALSLVIILFIFYPLVQIKIRLVSVRLALTVLLFANLLVATIFHTGKVWPLTTALLVASFFCLYRVLVGERRFVFGAVVAAFLAFANFPLAGIGLIAIPLLVFYYRHNQWPIKELIGSTAIGALVAILLFSLNYQGIYAQVFSIINDYTLSPVAQAHNVSITESVILFLLKLGMLFAPLLVALVAVAGNIIDRKLFWLSLAYLIIYLSAISVTARWAYDLGSYFRYLLPAGFWLTFMILSFDLNNLNTWRRLIVGLSAGVTLIYFGFAVYYLLIPSTLNKARDWTMDNLNNPRVAIINDAGPLYEPPLNQASARALIDYSCGSRCRLFREGELTSSFKPLVLDSRVSTRLPEGFASVYRVATEELADDNWELIYQITNPSYRGRAQTIDSFGDYFNLNFFKLKNWGDNFYIYQQK